MKFTGTYILTVGCALVTVVILYGQCVDHPMARGTEGGVPGNSLGQGFTSSSTLTHLLGVSGAPTGTVGGAAIGRRSMRSTSFGTPVRVGHVTFCGGGTRWGQNERFVTLFVHVRTGTSLYTSSVWFPLGFLPALARLAPRESVQIARVERTGRTTPELYGCSMCYTSRKKELLGSCR